MCEFIGIEMLIKTLRLNAQINTLFFNKNIVFQTGAGYSYFLAENILT